MRIRNASFAALFVLAAAACGGDEPQPAPPPQPAMNGPKPVLAAAPYVAPADADDAAIDKAAQAYVDLVLDISPESATGLGLHARDGLLDDRSLDGYEKNTQKEEAMLKDLQTRFANPTASMRAKTDLEILEHTLEVDVRLRRDVKPLVTQPDSYCGPMNAIFWMTAREYAPAPERAENVLARMEKIPKMLKGAEANISNPPKVWTEIGIESAEGAKTFFDDQRSFLKTALPEAGDRIEKAIKRAREAYLAYAAFLKKDVLPKSNGDYA
ncbi:MAG: DUF885 family protein, partial [Polyangiaceae bacterium]